MPSKTSAVSEKPEKMKRFRRWLLLLIALAIALPIGVSLFRDWEPRFTFRNLGDVRRDSETVSLIRLVSNPEAFEGKAVRVEGILRVEFEGDALFLSEADLRHRISKNGIWIDIPEKWLPQLEKLSGHYVLVEGVFATGTGHMGAYSGTINELNRVMLVW
jgi:hypothetical protein